MVVLLEKQLLQEVRKQVLKRQEQNMLLDIKIEDDEFQMVLENYILGVLYAD